jgi:hypothetical protein
MPMEITRRAVIGIQETQSWLGRRKHEAGQSSAHARNGNEIDDNDAAKCK